MEIITPAYKVEWQEGSQTSYALYFINEKTYSKFLMGEVWFISTGPYGGRWNHSYYTRGSEPFYSTLEEAKVALLNLFR